MDGGANDRGWNVEALYRQYFEQMPSYVTVQDRDLRIVHANRAFREDFGDSTERYCYQIYKHRSERCDDCPVERTFHDGHRHTSEQRVQTLDGREVSVIVYTTPIRDDAGEIIAVLEMSTDITEVKRLQQQVQDSRKRYRQLFEEVPCHISIQDRDLRIIETNRRFRDDFGSHLGCKCYEVYKHRNEECIPCPVQQTFEDGQVHRSEEVVTAKDGSRMNQLVYSTPIRDAEGAIQAVMEMSTDITPIRQLQSQVESIGMLISSVSHGLKGLLTGLDGGRYLVNSGLKKDNEKRVHQGWEMVERNVDRIRGMVMNILYYAKERSPNWERLEAAAVAAEVCDLIRPRAEEHGVDLTCEVPDDAGQLEADPNALRSLLVNLAENSVDACRLDKKKPTHAVSVRVVPTADRVTFEIQDDGIGMDQETQDKAFTLFFSSKGSEGTGLGLFIAYKIATAHGGTIRLESELDRGTRFVVEMPRRRAPAVQEAPVD
ncbi:MAG: PAS domain-containing sensor histidine kinase [Deltaproteobacteria bacterium]|jgi:PAS domain S-box-containing protein|nr:PAS domain-containing sensor histidine kinase [Deltaproteobacteria bacterium]MBW2532914.1 PAS domain-containing sensor histidine kinase [Deltaproteobacteria bacterium]